MCYRNYNILKKTLSKFKSFRAVLRKCAIFDYTFNVKRV
mgnify:CR=1 FL=1